MEAEAVTEAAQWNRRKTALITGASSGIGYELARLFGRARYNLVLVARDEQRLGGLARELEGRYGAGTRVLARDLANPAAPDELFAVLGRESVAVDVLVNNAGFGTYGPFAETELAAELQMIQVNVACLTHLTKL